MSAPPGGGGSALALEPYLPSAACSLIDCGVVAVFAWPPNRSFQLSSLPIGTRQLAPQPTSFAHLNANARSLRSHRPHAHNYYIDSAHPILPPPPSRLVSTARSSETNGLASWRLCRWALVSSPTKHVVTAAGPESESSSASRRRLFVLTTISQTTPAAAFAFVPWASSPITTSPVGS